MARFPPARLVGVDDRTAPDCVLERRDHRRRPRRHLLDGPDQRAHAQVQPRQRPEQALDQGKRQPGFLPQDGDQAYPPIPQAALAGHDPGQLWGRCAASSTIRATAFEIGMRSDHHWGQGQLDDFPGPFDRAPGQRRGAIRTGGQGMNLTCGRLHPAPGCPRRPARAGSSVAYRRFGRLEPGHAGRETTGWIVIVSARLGAKQGGQLGDRRLLLDQCGLHDRQSLIPVGQRIALLEDHRTHFRTRGVGEINHAPILRPLGLPENPSPKSEWLRH